MKKVLFMMAAVLLFCSCATFGNFPNLKQGESTQENVLTMLGEPSSKRYEGEHEVWQYRFDKKNDELKDKMRTILNLDITFKEKAVDNYNLSVSKEAVKEVQKEEIQKVIPLPPSQSPSTPGMREKGNFIRDFDRDNDGRVSRSEFPGPEDVFNRFDRNHDGFIDESETPPPPRDQGPMQRPMTPQGGRQY